MGGSYDQNIQEVVDRRIASLQYLKDVQRGNLFWLNTIQFSKKEFDKISTDDSKNLFNANHYFILGGSVPGLITSKALSLTEYLTNFLMLMKEYNAFINPTSDTLSSKAKMTGAVVQVGRRLFKSRTKHINGANNQSNLLSRNQSSSNLLAELEPSNNVSNFNGSSATMLKSPSSSSETSNLSIHPQSSTTSNNSNQNSSQTSQSQLPTTSHTDSLSISSTSSSSSVSSGTASLTGSNFGLRSRPSSVIATATSFSSLKTAASNGFGRHRLEKNRDSLTPLGTLKNASNLTINETSTFRANSSNLSIGNPIPTLSGTAGSQIVNAIIPTSNGQILAKEYSHLTIYHMPFSPDMFETFQTLCEVLIEAYRRIYSFLSSQSPSSAISDDTYSNYFSTSSNEVQHNFTGNSSFVKTNGTSHDSYDLLLKIDEHIKKFIIGPSVRGIDMISKSLIYEETKKLENLLIHTK